MNIGTTLIKVFRNEMAPQGWHFSEEEAADDFRNNEEKIMTEELVKKGTYELKDVKKGAATIGGKKFYTMSYKTTTGSFWGQFVEGGASYHAVESALYLFFPPDFKKTHIFYGFLISDYYLRGHLYVTKKTDLAQIYPVINSFRIISPPVEFPVGMNGELLSAAAEGNISNIKNLVNKGADVNARSDTGWTPLMYLSAIGNKEVASLLIEKGADVNQKNNQGQTPLFLAAHWGHSELAGLLIGKNADINAQMDDGWPVLTDAIDMHRVEIAKMLIDKGADVNLKSKKGWTALMAASLKNHPDIVRLLIEKGADVNATDEKDTSALTIAKRSGHVEIVRLLKEAGAKE
jgi:ankyrin repeat protein